MIPKGKGICWSTYHMHRREELYGDDAECYRPERWETGELDGIGFGFMPFHGGPRLCLGSELSSDCPCLCVWIADKVDRGLRVDGGFMRYRKDPSDPFEYSATGQPSHRADRSGEAVLRYPNHECGGLQSCLGLM